MILAGIDEAGLGPAIGPLCVCLTALRVPDGVDAAWPWTALTDAVSRDCIRGDGRLLVTDSKIVHRSRRLAGLEAAALSFMANGDGDIHSGWTRRGIFEALSETEFLAAGESIPWFRHAEWNVPGEMETDALAGGVSQLRDACRSAELAIERLAARVIPAAGLNRLFASGLNKSEAAWRQVAGLLTDLLTACPGETVLLHVDKQGGRNDYLPQLTALFPGEWVETIQAGKDGSEYRVRLDGRDVFLHFAPRADGSAFAVALASIWAKYLRERCMADLNAWFIEWTPELKPTAGYHGDAPRFIEAVRGVMESEGVPRSMLVRER